jgi:hypothetical protein
MAFSGCASAPLAVRADEVPETSRVPGPRRKLWHRPWGAFVDAFRAGALRLRERAGEIRDLFPLWAFPPPLPFNAPA